MFSCLTFFIHFCCLDPISVRLCLLIESQLLRPSLAPGSTSPRPKARVAVFGSWMGCLVIVFLVLCCFCSVVCFVVLACLAGFKFLFVVLWWFYCLLLLLFCGLWWILHFLLFAQMNAWSNNRNLGAKTAAIRSPFDPLDNAQGFESYA